jgi:hypothetical protein
VPAAIYEDARKYDVISSRDAARLAHEATTNTASLHRKLCLHVSLRRTISIDLIDVFR